MRRATRGLPLLRRLAVARVGPLERRLAEQAEHLGRLADEVASLKDALALVADRAEGGSVNHELIKGELFDLRQDVGSFARSVEDGASLQRAGLVLADVRLGLSEVSRRLRRVERDALAPAQSDTAEEDGDAPVAGRVSSTLFDYVAFEERFRGDPDVINDVLRDRYVEVLRQHQPVVDIGCGRGELLELLQAEGLDVLGVEPDPGMAAEARSRGIDVRETVADVFLSGVPDDSLGAVISTHVVEHLDLEALTGFIELSARKLRPGGVFIAETPNPATLMVLGSHFIMDPTHEWPLHPELMSFLCTSAGFDSVRAEFYSPADTMFLPLGGGDEGDGPLAARVDTAFRQLNHVLFGPQDYAVFAFAGRGSETLRDVDPEGAARSS